LLTCAAFWNVAVIPRDVRIFGETPGRFAIVRTAAVAMIS